MGYDVDGDGVPDMFGIVDSSTHEVTELVSPEIYQRRFSSDVPEEEKEQTLSQDIEGSFDSKEEEQQKPSSSSSLSSSSCNVKNSEPPQQDRSSENKNERDEEEPPKTLALETIQTMSVAKSRLNQMYSDLEQSVSHVIESTSSFCLNETKSNQKLSSALSSLQTSKEKIDYAIRYLEERNRGLSKVLEGMMQAKDVLSKRVRESQDDSILILESKLNSCASIARRVRFMRDLLLLRGVSTCSVSSNPQREMLRDLTRTVLDAKSETLFCKDSMTLVNLQDQVRASARDLSDTSAAVELVHQKIKYNKNYQYK